LVGLLEGVEGVVMDLEDFKEVNEDLVRYLSAINDIRVSLGIECLSESSIGSYPSSLCIKFLKSLLNRHLSLRIQLSKNSIHEFLNRNGAVSVTIEVAEESLNIGLLKVDLEIPESLLELIVLESPIVIEIECKEQLLQSKEAPLTPLNALLSDSLDVILHVLWLLDLWLLNNLLHFLPSETRVVVARGCKRVILALYSRSLIEVLSSLPVVLLIVGN
jgi:hypothetical protein